MTKTMASLSGCGGVVVHCHSQDSSLMRDAVSVDVVAGLLVHVVMEHAGTQRVLQALHAFESTRQSSVPAIRTASTR